MMRLINHFIEKLETKLHVIAVSNKSLIIDSQCFVYDIN